MPSEIFKRADTRYLAAALGDNTTHAGIGTFEMSVGLSTAGNKGERANQVIQHIFKEPDTDALVIELLNYLYVENPYANTSDANAAFAQLNEKVLKPRGITLTENGYALPDGRDIDQLERVERPAPPAPSTAPFDDVFSTPFQRTDAVHIGGTAFERDRSKVFVVHGSDMRPVAVLKQYLMFLGLHMMPWSEAVKLTKKPQPHTYDVVLAGMTHASAVIVVFSPDDLARVKDDFSQTGDTDRNPQGQPRQNVILEAGMAFALAPDRTIFLKSAATRDISDIAGFNWVKLNGEWDSRLDLKNRLESAGAQMRQGTYDLRDALAGLFQVTD